MTVYVFKTSELICVIFGTIQYCFNRCVQNVVEYAKNHENWFRHFKDISRRCEPSNATAYFLDPACTCRLVGCYLSVTYCLYSNAISAICFRLALYSSSANPCTTKNSFKSYEVGEPVQSTVKLMTTQVHKCLCKTITF